MKIPLVKASFIGAKNDLKRVLELLKSTAAFQMTFFKRAQGEVATADRDNHDRLLGIQSRLKHMISFAQDVEKQLKIKNSAWRTNTMINYDDINAFAEYHNDAMDIIAELEKVQGELNHIKNTIAYNTATVDGLKPYLALDVPFSELNIDTNSVRILCGLVPKQGLAKFSSEFDLSKMPMLSVQSIDNKVCVVITAHHEDAKIAEMIYEYGFEVCKFDFDKNATTMTEALKAETNALKATYTATQHNALLSAEDVAVLQKYYDYVSNEIDTVMLAANTLQTEKYYVLNGWVIESEQERITVLLKQLGADLGTDIAVKFEPASDNDEAPVYLKNSKIVTPFRQITNMYGPPSNTDIDPNPFVALFYFIFFGMMIGDVGYGLILSVAVAIFVYYKKPFGNTRQLLLLFGLGGISALLWGLFYGSVFGFIIPTRVLDPLGSDGAIYLLLLSLGMGMVQMFVGIALRLYRNILNKKYWAAALDNIPRIILFIGLFLVIPKLAFEMFKLNISSPVLDAMQLPGMIISLVGVVGIVLFNGRTKKGIFGKLIGGFAGAYGLINYFNDVISYVRLFALALVGSVIALIGNDLGSMMFGVPVVGYPLGIVVALAFHAFNIGLGLLSAYVHGARLHFIEFFSKFYSGDGMEFVPIGSQLKYTRIIGGE